MNARKGNITVEPYTRSVRTVQREGRKSLNFPSTLLSPAGGQWSQLRCTGRICWKKAGTESVGIQQQAQCLGDGKGIWQWNETEGNAT